jgi:hypothetical protein
MGFCCGFLFWAVTSAYDSWRMDYLEWPSNYVARCAVTIYEAAGGSMGWHNSGTVGELHMRPLGDGMINFQLHDLLDGQMLFEHTLRKPEALNVPVQQFFVIRQDVCV